MYINNPYYRYYLQNNQHKQPPGEGYKWINKNVDIMLNNGSKFCDVRFIAVQPSPTVPGLPVEYVWVFDDYSTGGAPVTRSINPIDVLEINQSGTICGSPSGPSGPGGCQWRWVPPFGWICI
ncbi:hypothetical protein [Lysinibacillus fusiformis]|uniref:hypothetical protein n=1 Tax=Lysinibacillus fusiformis TaxID=28031 RepID=UPI002E20BC34|nr:hypothetical protein [Lysinibacillus fusiformis]